MKFYVYNINKEILNNNSVLYSKTLKFKWNETFIIIKAYKPITVVWRDILV
jgi:hypothetical protein